jgi:hypothetical protein
MISDETKGNTGAKKWMIIQKPYFCLRLVAKMDDKVFNVIKPYIYRTKTCKNYVP